MGFKYIYKSFATSKINFRTLLRDPFPFIRHLHAPSTIPRKPLIYFVSIEFCLLCKYHIKIIIQYVAFCVCLLLRMMLSRFIHLVACIRTLFLFITQ